MEVEVVEVDSSPNDPTESLKVGSSNSNPPIPQQEQRGPSIPDNGPQSPRPPQKCSFKPCCGLIPLRAAVLLIAIFGIVTACTISVVIFCSEEYLYVPPEVQDPGGMGIEAFIAVSGVVYPMLLLTLNLMLLMGAGQPNIIFCCIWIIVNCFHMWAFAVIGLQRKDVFILIVVPIFFPGIYFIIVVIMYIWELKTSRTRVNPPQQNLQVVEGHPPQNQQDEEGHPPQNPQDGEGHPPQNQQDGGNGDGSIVILSP